MKQLLIIGIIFSSIISGLIGTFIMLEVYPHYLNGNIKILKGETKEIIKQEKTINITDLQNEVTKLTKKVSSSVVNIVTTKDLTLYRQNPFGFFHEAAGKVKKKIGGGTGFFVTSNGIIITNKHVVNDNDAQHTVITNDGKEYNAIIVAKDPSTDLAILKIYNDDGSDFVGKSLNIIGENANINIGQFVIAVGNALAEFQNTLTLGVVSGKNRNITAGIEGEKLSGLLQTDAAINPGNSGGPLINLNGEVIGINTAIAANSNSLGFAIPVTKERINYILNSIEKYGVIRKPFIGIKYQLITVGLAKQIGVDVDYGAYIPEEKDVISPGSEAEKSGIKPGEIILSIDNKKVDISNTVGSLIQNKLPGDLLDLRIMGKDQKVRKITLKLGEL